MACFIYLCHTVVVGRFKEGGCWRSQWWTWQNLRCWWFNNCGSGFNGCRGVRVQVSVNQFLSPPWFETCFSPAPLYCSKMKTQLFTQSKERFRYDAQWESTLEKNHSIIGFRHPYVSPFGFEHPIDQCIANCHCTNTTTHS